ncbi:MAG: hypothetical protein RM347_019915 [Nostoc sp. ChiQUE02]|nr:hypothetical protein [Nostoc sp. ChiQUE02]
MPGSNTKNTPEPLFFMANNATPYIFQKNNPHQFLSKSGAVSSLLYETLLLACLTEGIRQATLYIRQMLQIIIQKSFQINCGCNPQ